MNKSVAASALMAGAAMMLLQLIPQHVPPNPGITVENTIESNLQVPPRVQEIMARACNDCHTDRTRWPWYAKIAPISWAVANDVERARRAVNFSEWSVYAGGKPRTAIATLMAACAGMESGRMPPSPYRLMHPESQLGPEDVRSFCEWTVEEARRLRAASIVARTARKAFDK